MNKDDVRIGCQYLAKVIYENEIRFIGHVRVTKMGRSNVGTYDVNTIIESIIYNNNWCSDDIGMTALFDYKELYPIFEPNDILKDML